MGDGIEIRGAVAVANPEPFPPGALEAGVIPLTFRAKSIDALETQALTVNGEAVVVGKGLVLGTAAVFLAVVPVFVVTGALTGFGLAEGAAVFLAQPAVAVGGFSIPVHCEAGLADGRAGRKLCEIFGIALVERNNSIAVVNVFDGVVDVLGVVAFVGDEGTFLQRYDLVGLFEYGFDHGRIRDLGGGGQLV